MVRVGEVLRLERRAVQIDPTREYRLLGVYSWGKGAFLRHPQTGAELRDYRFFSIEPGDLILSNIQAWEGAIAHSGPSEVGAVGTHRFLTYVPRDGRIDTNWARWFFLSEPGMELIRQAAPGTTMRNRTLAIDRFEALEIPLPSIESQREASRTIAGVSHAVAKVEQRRTRAAALAASVPNALFSTLLSNVKREPQKLGDVLDLVRRQVGINPTDQYVTMGVRSFGRGLFHYPSRPGSEIGKLRFQSVPPGLLVLSNIKAWEGAIATTSTSDAKAIASNRFMFFFPRAGDDAVWFYWALLLGRTGLEAIGGASPGSADRNRTLSMKRFKEIELDIPSAQHQVAIGRRIADLMVDLTRHKCLVHRSSQRVHAVLSASLNDAFADFR